MKPPILLLCHRIPYPPDKGDKIRSYNLLVHLSKTYSVHLAAFVDEARDTQYHEKLTSHCQAIFLLSINPVWSKFKSLLALFTKHPISRNFYRHRAFQKWVDDVVTQHPYIPVIVFSSSIAQFVMDRQDIGLRIVDFVDVDSDKWRQYALTKPWPMSWLYNREFETLAAYEEQVGNWSNKNFFVSKAEADLFVDLHPHLESKIDHYNNGVDAAYFSPDENLLTPYQGAEKIVVFTGAMDYWPNVDAVVWFAEEVMPLLLNIDDSWHFYIVGSKPVKAVQKLVNHKKISVTGRVQDIRPYLSHADVSVAPMRMARGIQNKVLEAMAMELPVVVSSKGLEGIDAVHDQHLYIADEASEYVRILQHMDIETSARLGGNARMLVKSKFSWSFSLKRLDASLRTNMQPQQQN